MMLAELDSAEAEVAKQQARLAKSREVTLAGPSSAGTSAGLSALSQGAQQRVIRSLAAAAKTDDWALMDAADDARFADGERRDGRELRYYLIRICGAARTLTAPLRNTDWGDLPAGTQVIEAEYYWLWYRPGNPARWYVPGAPRRFPTVPTELLLRVGFDMPPATLHGKSSLQQKKACDRGAVVLDQEVHERALGVLKQR
jgi:hypothetical protein